METVYNFITGGSLMLYLIGFIVASYVLVGLLTWSFIKPLKYLGFPIIIVGLISFGLKGILSIVIDSIAEDKAGIIKAFINNSGNLFMKYAIICIIIGLLMVVAYFVLNRTLKQHKKEKKSNYGIQNSHTEEYAPIPYNDEIVQDDEDEIINE